MEASQPSKIGVSLNMVPAPKGDRQPKKYLARSIIHSGLTALTEKQLISSFSRWFQMMNIPENLPEEASGKTPQDQVIINQMVVGGNLG
jgi:hypothetical protein